MPHAPFLPRAAPLLGVLILAGAGPTAGPRADTTFTERFVSSDSPQPAGVVVADMDADGDADVVAAEYTGNTVAWYQNSGATPPAWTKRVIDAGAAGPITVAVGDVDRDGDLDVFSANFNDEGIAWYENRGVTGSWTKRVISGFWTGPWGVAAADVDGDGDIDAIGGLTNSICGPPLVCSGVEWYDNDGATPPGFTTRPVSPGLLGASSVQAADVEGDGDLDILSVDTAGDRIVWYQNGGQHPPVWTERLVTLGVDDPWAVFAADLDRDGDLDVLSASAEDDRVTWHESDGAALPAFSSHTLSSVRDGAISVQAADLDGDGDPDVIAGSWWDSTLAWYESDGGADPVFVERVIATCGGPEGIAAGRVDADADVDVLCAANPGWKIHLFDNDADFADADGDTVRDALDCAPVNPAAFAVPAEVRDLRFESSTELRWTPAGPGAGPGTAHDVVRGELQTPGPGEAAAQSCLGSGIAGTVLVDGSLPAPGRAFSYMVRGSNICGAGSYGTGSSGTPRASDACL